MVFYYMNLHFILYILCFFGVSEIFNNFKLMFHQIMWHTTAWMKMIRAHYAKVTI